MTRAATTSTTRCSTSACPATASRSPSCRRAASCSTARTEGGKPRLLLQIFSETLLGPVFFEFIQRKGDDGFGEGNFKALFEIDRARPDAPRRAAIDAMSARADDRATATSPASATSSRPRRVPGALPVGRNSPQRVPVRPVRRAAVAAPPSPRRAPRTGARWLYRIRPSAMHPPFEPHRRTAASSATSTRSPAPPNQLRWDPLPMPDGADRLRRRPGDDGRQRRRRPRRPASAIHLYAANRSMERPRLLRRRRRAADRAAAGPAALRHRARRARRRAAGDRA